MKNHLNRFLALFVALLVLCAPLSAMAEDYQSATIVLKNFTMSVGEEKVTIEAGVQLDVGADPETGAITATLAALAQDQQALKGGLIADMAGMKLIAGLEGMTDGILVPLDELMEMVEAQMSSMMPGGGLESAQKLMTALEELMSAAQSSEAAGAIQQAVMAWLGEHFPEDGNKGETEIAEHGMVLTVNQYAFSFTVADCLDLISAVWKIAQGDAELVPAMQNFMDAWCDVGGIDHVDVSAIDVDAIFAESMQGADAVTISGSLYTNDSGVAVLDVNIWGGEGEDAEMLPLHFAMLPIDNVESISFTMEAEETVLETEALIPLDGTSAFSFTIHAVGEGQDVKIEFTMNAEDGLAVSLYGEATSSYSFDGQVYKSLTAVGVSYAGAPEATEGGTAFNGVLTLYANTNGQEVSLSADMLVSLNEANTAVFDAPHNLIDITKADDETMGSLMNEFMAALQNGLAVMMSVPGLASLMGGVMGSAA